MRVQGVLPRAEQHNGAAGKTHRVRLMMYTGLAIVLVCHVVALYFVRTASVWTSFGLLVLILTSALITTAIFLAHLNWLRVTAGANNDAISAWLENIDLAGERPEQPDWVLDESNTQLVTAAEALVRRVHHYRARLRVRHQRVQRLLRNVTDVLYHVDESGHITWITDTVREMLGYTPFELEGRPLRYLLADPDTDYDALTNSPQLLRHPTRVYRRDGSLAWLLISSRRIDDAEGRAIGSEGICRDGTRLIETEHALGQAKERAEITLASIGEGVITTDAHGKVDYLNPRAETMLNVKASEAVTMHFDALCQLIDSEREIAVEGLVRECIDSGTTREWYDNLTLQQRTPHAVGHAVTVTLSPIRHGDNQIVGAVIVLHDITRLQQISREMTYQANHDLLTDLPNRRAFEQLLERYMREASEGVTEHALCYLDLDQFKLVNDTCGHNAGDEMLRQITDQLATRLRTDDTIARLGGDEFGVVMRNLSLADAQIKAEQLRAEIDTFRFRWEDKLFRLGVSIGVAAIDREAVSATELLRRADTACYLAKEKGRNQVYVYRGDSDETQTRHGDMQRMQQISEALENDGFELFAQVVRPLNFRPGMQVGVELLLRMPGRNAMEPQNFLTTAERYDAASRIDRWVLRRSLELIARSAKQHSIIEHYSINISGQSITDEHFVDYVRTSIRAAGVDPRRLVFEITETTAVTGIRRAGELIRSLRALGCRFSLDDFGSGLSSFSYLKHLPSDYIKIDGKLVSQILEDRVERSIVESINQVGQAMGLKTVAEHVESPALLAALETIGVDYVQGYHVARPIPFRQLTESLAGRNWVAANDAAPIAHGGGR